jgi:hypothetical protein
MPMKNGDEAPRRLAEEPLSLGFGVVVVRTKPTYRRIYRRVKKDRHQRSQIHDVDFRSKGRGFQNTYLYGRTT